MQEEPCPENWEGFCLNRTSTTQIRTQAFLLTSTASTVTELFIPSDNIRDLMINFFPPITELHLDIQGLVTHTKESFIPITAPSIEMTSGGRLLIQPQIPDIKKMWEEVKTPWCPGRQYHRTCNSLNTKPGTNNNTKSCCDCADWNVLLSTSSTSKH